MGKTHNLQHRTEVKVHRLSFIAVITTFVIAGLALVAVIGEHLYDRGREERHQDKIQTFYDTPSELPSTVPGTLLRSERMELTIPNGGTAYRVLYVTQTPEDQPAISSGMVFVPAIQAPPEGRKVIAWAHGTLGLGDECTPSRSRLNALRDMENWLGAAMQRGYIVTATDYTGVGTDGQPYYLVGKSEAYDVINSVRAARNMPEAHAGDEFIPWGHSQGGHSALAAAIEAPTYAPELKLVAVAAAAPAAELKTLFSQQYNKAVAWAIGPDTAVSWPEVHPQLELSTLTKRAQKNYERLAFGCIEQQAAGLSIRAIFDDQFFASNPMDDPAWAEAATAETPKVKDITVPIYVAQGLSDAVVLPNTTALLAQKACASNKTIELNWLGTTNHQLTAITAGIDAIAWMQDRFSGAPARSTCSQPLPILPATE